MLERAMRERLADELKAAMRAGDKTRLGTIRLIQAAIQKRDLELGEQAFKRAEAAGGEVASGAGKAQASEEEILGVLQKMVKQRQESIALYEKAARPELAQKEQDEIAVIEDFLPKQLDEAGVAAAVDAAIAATGAAGVKDMGKVMAELRAKHAGRMDFGKASAVVKAKLG
jgi:uncharacterized protein YqeY